MPKIIGISGKKHAGKDTATNAFIATLSDIPIEHMAFADALKDEVCEAVHVTREFLEANKDLFRPILQWWGTEFRRNLHGDGYWINRLAEKVAASKAAVIIITDVRFLNEYAWVDAQSGSTLIRIHRVIGGASQDTHASEVELDHEQFDYTLYNDSIKEVFEHHCARFANRVLTQRLGIPTRGEPERNEPGTWELWEDGGLIELFYAIQPDEKSREEARKLVEKMYKDSQHNQLTITDESRTMIKL